MATPYSLDLRERIMKDYDGGYPIANIKRSKTFMVANCNIAILAPQTMTNGRQ